MSSKSSISKAKTKAKNEYATGLIDDFKKIQNGSLKSININLNTVKASEVIKLIQQNITNHRLFFKLDGNKFYALTEYTMDKLSKGLIDQNRVAGDHSFSDAELQSITSYSNIVTLQTLEEKVKSQEMELLHNPEPIHPTGNKRMNKKGKPQGSFFKYYNKTHFDLTKYGIYKATDKADYDNNCFYNALKAGGLDDFKLQLLKHYILNRSTPKCVIKQVCIDLLICVKVRTINNDGKSRTEVFGEKTNAQYNIGLVDEHYFIIDKTDITSYCIKNYNTVKDLENCHMIWNNYKGEYKRANNKDIDSFALIKLLLEDKDTFLDRITCDEQIMKSQFYDKVDTYITLEYPPSCIQYKTYKPPMNIKFYKVFFDFETITTDTHIPYMVRYKTEDGEKREFTGSTLITDFLDNLPQKENIMLIAHNANYDCRFLIKYISRGKPIQQGNRYLTISGRYYRNKDKEQPINIIIKDSYKMIPFALGKFGKSFGLEQEKDVIPYKIYTIENVERVFVPILEASRYIKENQQTQFIANIDKWECRGEGHRFNDFNIMKYASKYCEIDCDVLMSGYEKYREWFLEEPIGLDIDNYITLQSLASAYELKAGCYDGVAMVSGVIQHFINQCVVGGRTMTNSNKMWHVTCKVADFDCCSQYPSSMSRMNGYLKGTPKVIQSSQLNYDFLKQQSGYFVKIKILHVTTHRHFPLLSKKNEYGVRVFRNDLVDEEIYIDKVGLEDAINFQGIRFSIIEGYYFDQGFNDTINTVINKLYNLRKELKEKKNPAEQAYKLFMNSMYGIKLLNPIDTDNKVIPFTEWNDYVSKYYNFIKEVIKVGGKYYVKQIKPIINHFNYVHIGCEILSTSKRIMNEVMCLAEDLDLNMFYQDTDSIHIVYEDVEVLAKAFEDKYNKTLQGDDMGQFHIDFDILDDSGEKVKGLTEICSTESYFIGKKVYYDKLLGVYPNGETVTGDHIRLKSIPTSCVKYQTGLTNITPLDMYKHFYEGSSVTFDLTENNSKPIFEYQKDKSIKSKYQAIDNEKNGTTKYIRFDDDIERVEYPKQNNI